MSSALSSNELIFIHEDEFSVRIDEASNQPGTGNSIHLDVLAGNPLHGRIRNSAVPTTVKDQAFDIRVAALSD